MIYTQEQSEEIKKQLIEQIEKLPNENKEQIKHQIMSLNSEQLEEFLKQNNIQSSEVQDGFKQSEKPVFESIVNNEIPSYKIAENNKAIAILEINPLSKGHILIIPKQKTTVEKLPKSCLSLAQKIAKKIKIKLKPKEMKIETFSFQDYPAINVIPIYNEPLKKQKANEEELISLQKKLGTKGRAKRKVKSKNILNSLSELKFRIPY